MILDYDVETTGVQPYSGGHRVFMHQFGDPDGTVRVYTETPENREAIQAEFNNVLANPEIMLRAWNARFDRAFAEAVAGYTVPGNGRWRDGMISAHAIDENRSVALKAVGDDVLGPGASDLQKQVKEWLTKERARRKKEAKENGTELVEPNYSDVPMELMEPYAIEDIHLQRRIGEVYDPIIANSADLKRVVEFEHEVFDALYDVESRGFPADDEGYRRLEIEVVQNLERIEADLDSLAKVGWKAEGDEEFDFNAKSSFQIIEALKRRGADMQFMSKKNGKIVSADAENLRAVDDALAEKVLEFRTEYKTLSTYVRPMIEKSYAESLRSWKLPFIAPDGRVHAGYRQLGAKTGRMSCSDPNIQNQPRDDLRLRYNFRAEPGHKLVCVDLSNIEMRVFAAYAGEGALLQAIRDGYDIHQLTADNVGLRDRRRAGGTIEHARQRAKNLNFSIVYGGGIRTLRKQLRCSSDDARLVLNRYHDAYPEVGRLQNRIEWKLEDTGYIKSLIGRRFRVEPRKSYAAVNYLVQGTSADILKMALIRCHKAGVPIVACVHDELLAHVPTEDAEEAMQIMIEAMTDIPEISEKVPLEAEGVIVDRWSDAKPLDDGSLFVPHWAEAAYA